MTRIRTAHSNPLLQQLLNREFVRKFLFSKTMQSLKSNDAISSILQKQNRKYFFIAGILFLLYMVTSSIFTPEAVVMSVRRGNAIQAVTGTMTVEPAINTEILSSGDGFIIKSNLKEGLNVQAGDILAQIDPSNLPFNIKETKLQLESAKKQLEEGSPQRYTAEKLRLSLEQNRDLVDLGHYPKLKYEEEEKQLKLVESQIRMQMEENRSNVSILENKIKQLEDQLERLTIKAPFDGTITTIYSHKGDQMGVGTSIAKIISNEKRIHAEVNQDDIAAIRPGNSAKIRFFAYPNDLYPAKVTQIIPHTDSTTQRFVVYLELIDPPKDLLPGLKGEVSFYTGEKSDTLIIPRQALLGNNVLVVDSGEIAVRKVQTGYVSYSEAEIVDGVEEGELVVVRDLDLFRRGDSVKAKVIDQLED